ncbi:HTH domain-containing protein, partial [Saprospiraceae bacterium]|nr:HTH domain-containing protein [Saprospiraceae bacterium]
MAEDLSRLSRLIALLRIFQTKSLVTAVELSDRFDLSVRTIYRDVKALQEAGVPIYSIEGKGYTIMKDYKFSPVSFSDEEANAIITAEKFIAKNRDQSFRDNYQSAVEKIKAVLRSDLKEKANLLEERLLYVSEVQEINSRNVSTIQQAITNQFVLEIEYTSFYKKEKSVREI